MKCQICGRLCSLESIPGPFLDPATPAAPQLANRYRLPPSSSKAANPRPSNAPKNHPRPLKNHVSSFLFPLNLFTSKQWLKELRLMKIRLCGSWQERTPKAAFWSSFQNRIDISSDFARIAIPTEGL